MTILAAYLRAGTHRQPVSWSTRTAAAAAWALEALAVIRAGLAWLAVVTAAVAFLLLALPWRF